MNYSKVRENNLMKRLFAIFLLVAVILSTFSPATSYAASDDVGVGTKVTLRHDHQIRYGTGVDGISNLMKATGIDDSLGDRYVFCTQPHMPAPSNGTYTIDKMYTSDTGNAAIIRKLVYYAKGYPGWSKGKSMWFSSGSWSDDDIYGIFHIALSYATAGYDDNMKAYSGGTVKASMYSDNWAKMKEIIEDCKSDEKVPDPPAGFKVFYIINSGYQNIIGGTLENGELTLTKASANPEMTQNNTCYSLEGAEFGVYKGSTKVATLTTKADGSSNTVELEAGTYTVKELTAPKGYAYEADQTVTVKAGRTTTVTFKDQPKDDPIAILLEKGDSETLKASPQGAAKLEGAVYEVKYYKHTSSGKTLDRTWRFKTNSNGIAHLTKDDLDTSFDNDDFYYSSTGDPCLPLGTVTIQEIEAPEGYLLNDTIYTTEITDDGGKIESVYTYNEPKIGSNAEVAEQVKRGDIEFVKVGDGTLERLAGVPFKITSLTTGESHIVVSDKNGYVSTASSWNKHTYNTNKGETSEDGIWFGEVDADDSKGALIYDDYELEELSCDANKGYDLVKIKFSVYKDSVTVPMGTLTDDKIEIGTTAKDDKTNSHLGKVEKTVYITDTVKYSGLKKGNTYKLVGTLMNKETGKAIEVDGKAVTAEKTFKAKASSGEVEVEFKVPGEVIQGTTTVVFEDLYLDEIHLATHADIDDEDQTVYYPEIKTTAKDSETNTGVSNADSKVAIIDTVTYKALMPGKEYTVAGTLMNKSTGKAIKIDGKTVTSEATFTAESSDGTVDVTFEFNAKSLAGKTTVVFESLQYKSKEIAVHADISDEGQTVYFPEIGTTAKDADTKTNSAKPDEKVTIIDTVTYKGLKPGLEYTVSGVLMDKSTGKELVINGETVTATKTFVPSKAEGSVDVEFTFNASELDGKDLVVFEKMLYGEVQIADHQNINDEGQTVKITSTPPTTPFNTPKTGDNTNMWIWLIIMFAAAAGMVGVKVYSAKSEASKSDKE